jgi:DNA invertase Pin-like site-specific DNA recombinase
MLADIDAGMVDTRALVWRTDRLTRQPGHLERFLDTCERRAVSLSSVTEPFDVGTNSGLFMLRQFVGLASYESGVKAERVAASTQSSLSGGSPLAARGVTAMRPTA